ncbi:MAG: metallophosphoesterase [Aquihabitans sp.]
MLRGDGGGENEANAVGSRPKAGGDTIKIGHLADVHLDSAFRWAGPEVGGRWRRAIRTTVTNAVDVALAEQVDAFFLGGDIYEHDYVSPDTAQFLADTLARLAPIPVLVAPGNHDYLCPSSLWVQASWSYNVHVFDFDRWQPFELVDGLTVWGTAHGRPAGTGPMLDQLGIDRGGINIGLFHGALRSGVPTGATAPEPHLPFDHVDIQRAGLHHAFSGHYHNPRHDEWLTYPGNPHPLTFGESPGRGLVIARIHDDGRVEADVRNVSPTTFHDVTVDLTEAHSSEVVRERVAAALTGLRGAARVHLVGDLATDLDLDAIGLTDQKGSLDAIVLRSSGLRPGYDLESIRNEATVRGQFLRDLEARTDLPPERHAAILQTGLRALDGRTDLAVQA